MPIKQKKSQGTQKQEDFNKQEFAATRMKQVDSWLKLSMSPYLCILTMLPLLATTSSGWAQPMNPPTLNLPNSQPSEEKPLQPPPIAAPSTTEERLNMPEAIIVHKFEFVGSTVFSQKELNQALADFIEKPISFAQLLQAANKITELYIKKGYITSGAYIPSQETQSGIVKVQVLEGSLEDIKVNIVKGRVNPNYVRNRIKRATGKPLNINRLQEALQLLQLNPLIEKIDAELTSGTKPGTNSLEVKVTGAKTFKTKFSIDNNRNPSVGSFERSIGISEANLLGLEDELSFTYSNTDGSNRFEGNYTLPVNSSNGTLSFNYQITNNTIVEPPFNNLDIKVDSREYELTFRQPVIQTATAKHSQELALGLSVARRESNGSILGVKFPLFPGADVNGSTRLTELNFSQEWLQRSRKDILSARSEFSLGIDAFDATINNNQPDSRFFLWRGQLLYLRRLGEEKGSPPISPTMLLRFNVQLTGDSLLSREQFSLGGQATVRGYRQDALLTDNGVSASAEARIPIVQVPEVQGTLQIAPFIDFGTVWNTNKNSPNPNTLVSIGFGLVWQMGERFTSRLDWGIPLVDIRSNGRTWQENGVYFQVEYNPF
jgi:hemolysin activation/secretion protein